ncbi:MAG: universal stress protein [Deltaproteobacteria bacterium]|nr:universal stress protein [Deltaproteobacteria bacterium]
MIDRIIVCLDGSLFAEQILPYARGIVGATGAALTLLRVLEVERQFAAAERYVQGLARHLGVEGKLKRGFENVPAAVLEELRERPAALPAITTHGRGGLLQAAIGSVALSVIRGADRPVFLYRPRAPASAGVADKTLTISTVVAPLDGSDYSAKILPFAGEIAKLLKTRLQLVQVLPEEGSQPQIPRELKRDILESSYLRNVAEESRKKYGIEVDWEVLHGAPAESLCSYVEGRQDLLLAMTSHARGGLERAIFGSVAGECVRRAGVLMMVYWPSA